MPINRLYQIWYSVPARNLIAKRIIAYAIKTTSNVANIVVAYNAKTKIVPMMITKISNNVDGNAMPPMFLMTKIKIIAR